MSTGDRLNDPAALAIGYAVLNGQTPAFRAIEPMPSEHARTVSLFEVAMNTLRQIASTPRNRKARVNARAAVWFIETQMEATELKNSIIESRNHETTVLS